jgi:hypothetical protein
MSRFPVAFFMLAGSIAALASLAAKAQSPDPGLLAPPAAQAGLAPPIWSPQPYPRYAVPALLGGIPKGHGRDPDWVSAEHPVDSPTRISACSCFPA